jgi:hypothetical protein
MPADRLNTGTQAPPLAHIPAPSAPGQGRNRFGPQGQGAGSKISSTGQLTMDRVVVTGKATETLPRWTHVGQ